MGTNACENETLSFGSRSYREGRICNIINQIPGEVLGLPTYGEVPLENLKSYPVPESDS